jgi:hypothetical protein
MSLDTLLKDIEERANAATPGPWGVDAGLKYTTGKTCHWQHVIGERGAAVCNTSSFEEVRIGDEVISPARNGKADDAAFIAHARTDIPTLLRIVREMQRALEEVNGINMRQYGSVEKLRDAAHRTPNVIAALFVFEALARCQEIAVEK